MINVHFSKNSTASLHFLKIRFLIVEVSDLMVVYMSILGALDYFEVTQKPKLMLKLRDWVSSGLNKILRTQLNYSGEKSYIVFNNLFYVLFIVTVHSEDFYAIKN